MRAAGAARRPARSRRQQRTRALLRQGLSEQRGELRPQQVERVALCFVEIAALAVEHEAHEKAPVHVQRQRHHAVDADAAVVVGVERSSPELRIREGVADTVRGAARRLRVVEHQRVLVEVRVERCPLARGEGAVGRAEDRAATAREVADAERGHFGGDQARQPVQPRACEALKAPGFGRDLVQQLQTPFGDASRGHGLPVSSSDYVETRMAP